MDPWSEVRDLIPGALRLDLTPVEKTSIQCILLVVQLRLMSRWETANRGGARGYRSI